ncbi:ABC transporter substrate-binding protein [Alsobacter sp. SYSU BS001988]
MIRRKFLFLIGAASVGVPLRGIAAQPLVNVRRIGVIMQIPEQDPEAQARLTALKHGLEQFGWIVGQNLQIEYKAASDPIHISAQVAALLASRPEVVLAVPSLNAEEIKKQSPNTPLIFVNIGDPVRAGLVDAVARPGRNTTGFMGVDPALPAKWVQILRELSPATSHFLALANPSPTDHAMVIAMQEQGRADGVDVSSAFVDNTQDLRRVLDGVPPDRNIALLVVPGGPITANREWIIQIAARRRWPALYGFRYYVAEGGLASYGASILDQWRRAASYVNRILNGENAGDLPVQSPSKYELILNMKTATALGLEIPTSILARADELLE